MNSALQAVQDWSRKKIGLACTGLRIPWVKPIALQESEDFIALLCELGYGTKQALIKGLQTNGEVAW